MKLSFIGLCIAGAAAIVLQTGTTAVSSGANAAESCIVVNVEKHVKKCPAGVAYSGGSAGSAQPTITPTAGPPPASASCIKTNVTLHVKRCPAGV